MPADPDLRAAVLAGIEREIADCEMLQHAPGGRTLTALRHLREIAEQHGGINDMDGNSWCGPCTKIKRRSVSASDCPTLLSLAPDYAPEALKAPREKV